MQYNVPQFVEVEDKIIGPLTLKQFLILLGGGLILFMFWSIFEGGAAFFLFALPIGAIFAYFAFGTFNGRPVFSSIPALLKFFTTSKERVFKRGADISTITMAKKTMGSTKGKAETAEPLEESRKSRLKRLAYLLDQKTAEEERLIHSGQIDKTWLNKI